MGELIRFGISIDSDLLRRFDRRSDEKGYSTRSEAIRDLIRDCLVSEEWGSDSGETVGVVSLVFDHHKLELPQKLVDVQHKKYDIIVTSTHVHLDDHNCLEVIILRGRGSEIRTTADQLMSRRGIKHGKLFMTTTGSELA